MSRALLSFLAQPNQISTQKGLTSGNGTLGIIGVSHLNYGKSILEDSGGKRIPNVGMYLYYA